MEVSGWLSYTGSRLRDRTKEDANQAILGLIMARRQKRERRYAICIKSDDLDLLTPRKTYEVLPDASAEKSNYIRVVDNEGEDYLYPASCFAFITLPDEVEKPLEASILASVPHTEKTAHSWDAG